MKASMDKVICVGFGEAQVLRNGIVVLDGEKICATAEGPEDLATFADAEKLAQADPNQDWRIVLNAPLHGETYQRQGEETWVVIEENQGFA